MDEPQHFPPISKQLLEALEKNFPDRAPELRFTDHEVWFKAGQAAVVRFLRAVFEEQTNPVHVEDT